MEVGCRIKFLLCVLIPTERCFVQMFIVLCQKSDSGDTDSFSKYQSYSLNCM